MNEDRIKLLAEQAEKECINITENFAWEWEKKFAELIVKDCMKLCKLKEQEYSKYRSETDDFVEKNIYSKGETTCNTLRSAIKTRFGVTE